MSKTFGSLMKEKERFFGSFIQMPSPEVVEIYGHAGFDFVIIDNEHSVTEAGITLELIRAAEAVGVTTVVRIPECADTYVKKTLDLGASAIICPGVSSAQQAKDLVYYGKYAPQGMRGSCPCVRSNQFGKGDISYYSRANAETTLLVQVEGKDGFDVFDDIIAVEGVGGLLLGPVDLSMSLGVPGQLDHPLVIETLTEMVKKARVQGLSVGMFSMDMADSKRWLDIGCNFIAYGVDSMMILEMATDTVNKLNVLNAAN